MSAWEKYRRKDSVRDRAGRPELAIWKKGTIAFTKAAYERYDISGFRFAEMLYENEDGKIGIRLQNDRANPDEILAITRGRSNVTIAASPFFKRFNIEIDRTRRYEIHEEDDLLVVHLKKAS